VLKSKYIIFSGKMNNLVNGRVEIIQDGRLISQGQIDKKNTWKIKVKEKRKSATYSYQFKYYNADNQNVETSKTYTIVNDREKPKFTYLPKKILASPGDTVSWQAVDSDRVEYYLYSFQGIKERTNDNFFFLPSSLPKGNSKLKVWAYDRAGNYATRTAKIRIR
jgi:plastocyanin